MAPPIVTLIVMLYPQLDLESEKTQTDGLFGWVLELAKEGRPTWISLGLGSQNE